MKKLFITCAFAATAASALVLIGVRSAETPDLGEMDAKVCVLADDCTWGEQIPDEFAETIEIERGVTLKQFRKDIQDVIDAVTRELKRDGLVVIDHNPGGELETFWTLSRYYAHMNTKVEVRGDCMSVSLPGDPVSPETTQLVFDSYPSDIQHWIGKAENLPAEGFWTLHAQDLWKMGYQKCVD